ncbi:hypothetical protein JXB27_02135 [Candidatus Woesearchaeota archaeon]|nr:hypothetical protein [Candidatus Woesearchaeota archaeon]
MKKRVLFVLAVLLILPIVYSLNLGVAKGYVLNISGVTEIGSNVTISVAGCTGTGCNANATADANGFYIKSNLNILPGDNVSVTARRGDAFGATSTLATGSGSVGVATINVTLCLAPQKPVLNAIADTHDNSLVSMSWTTYKAGAENDEFVFDSEASNTSAVSPQNKTLLSYESHTWKVRTCDGSCCSDYATDTFNITNSLPAEPVLTDESDTDNNTVAFEWAHSGTDADGDTIYFDFKIDGAVTSNVTSPYEKTELSFGSHTWGVRACDGIACTDFAEDSFSVSNDAPAAPTLTDQGHTQSTDVDFVWTNSSDPEGSATHNEFQIATDSTYTTIIHSDAEADSPKNVSFLSTFTLYYWRVRTCDSSNACSAYSEDTFFVYSCAGTATIVSGGRRTKYINETCLPDWECTTWGICTNGLSTRNCIDANDCGISIPVFYQFCTGPITEKPAQTSAKQEKPGLPISTEQMKEEVESFFNRLMGTSWYVPLILLVIILILLGIIYYQYKAYIIREIKVDKKLAEYIEIAVKNGFTEKQIREKLLENGFAEEEIEFVMRKMNLQKPKTKMIKLNSD